MDEQQKKRREGDVAGEDADAGRREQSRGISPVNPSSMPRAEDDEQTFARSPEYHDRTPRDPSRPRTGSDDVE